MRKRKTLKKNLPNPVIKRSKKVGGTWLEENIFMQDEINNLVNVETSACNTRNDVDKRSRRTIWICINEPG